MAQRIALRFGLTAAAALTLLAAAHGQATMPDPRKLVVIDRVVATVNDTVILSSDLNTLASSEIRVAETTKGSKLTDAERGFILNRNLQELINRAALSQAAKTLGVLPPDRVEDLLKGMMKEDEDQQIRDFGSMTFLDLRDRYGITQLVFKPEVDASLRDRAHTLGREFCVGVRDRKSTRLNSSHRT